MKVRAAGIPSGPSRRRAGSRDEGHAGAATSRKLAALTCAAAVAIAFEIAARAPAWPKSAVIVTQVPAHHGQDAGTASAGASRVVVIREPRARPSVLSEGLHAARSPAVDPIDGAIYFAGKAHANSRWKIYRSVRGGAPVSVTSSDMEATDPALLPGRHVVFVAHEPGGWRSFLHVQPAKKSAQQLTFAGIAASPTVLRDGRILFVWQRSLESPPALFTINRDGTEFTKFAVDAKPGIRIRRPRELEDGFIGFESTTNGHDWITQTIDPARPFHERVGGVLSRAPSSTPPWRTVDVVAMGDIAQPKGHLSTLDRSKSTGTLLCLNANFTRSTNPVRAARVRILIDLDGRLTALGETEVHRDGSFLVQVPADVPLGIESLDSHGNVVHRLHPSIWVRPGENRSCVGCHEPNNHSPENLRPIAANRPPVILSLPGNDPPRIARSDADTAKPLQSASLQGKGMP